MLHSTPSISIIIPVYNDPTTLLSQAPHADSFSDVRDMLGGSAVVSPPRAGVSFTQGVPFSMASLNRRYFNQRLLDCILDQLATEHRVEKFSSV